MVRKMSLALYQEEVKNYLLKLEENKNIKLWPKFVIIASLYDKISEISKIISVEEGYREKWKVENLDLTDEFGSALFHFIRLANSCNVDLEQSWDHIMEKYKKLLDNSNNKSNNTNSQS